MPTAASSPYLVQAPFALATLVLFFVYGSLVRRGVLRDRQVFGAGAGLVLVSMLLWLGATFFSTTPEVRASPLLFVSPATMGFCAAFCVVLAYRLQKRTELSTHTLGGTRITVQYSLPSRLPEADAVLAPTSTDLVLRGGIAGMLAPAAGKAVGEAALKTGKAGVGKIIGLDGGNLSAPKLYLAAVNEPTKGASAESLRRITGQAAHRAASDGAKTLTVPLGIVRGLGVRAAASAIAEGVLKHREKFGAIHFVAMEQRDAEEIQKAVLDAVAAAQNAPAPAKGKAAPA